VCKGFTALLGPLISCASGKPVITHMYLEW